MVAVSSVALEGAPAHLRYLVRRLRGRLPKTPIVAGIWREGDPFLTNAELQKTVGADAFVTSLRAAVDAAMPAPLPDRSETVVPVRSP